MARTSRGTRLMGDAKTHQTICSMLAPLRPRLSKGVTLILSTLIVGCVLVELQASEGID